MADLDLYNRQVIAAFRAGGGAVGGDLRGLSLLLLHHVGAKSGVERVTPLAYWRASDTSIAVLASNFGAPTNPRWYTNLLADPEATVELGTETWAVRARVASPVERRDLVDRISRESTAVAAAVSHTTRAIPVVLLDLVNRLP